MKNEREEAINKAISFIKTCAYKGTAIKIELEGQFGREGQTRTCVMCRGLGTLAHNCKTDACEECLNRGVMDCTGCGGAGVSPVANKRMTEVDVHNYILSNVSSEAQNALVYAQTYRDGSVDTEFTFTLMLDDVRYSIEFIKAFKSLETELGTQLQTNGAGMHVAILNSPDGNYPGGNSLDSRRANNFKYTMTRLLPALFFLASPTYASRRLNYRHPTVDLHEKIAAISGRQGCFEYRVFETCYERPDAILDNLCIIANTLKYYHYRKITLPFFGKIGTFKFIDYGQGIGRFYQNEVNYKALMEGVKVLKPSYKTISELRKERNFKTTLIKLRKEDLLQDKMLEAEYRRKREYVEKNHSDVISAANNGYSKLVLSSQGNARDIYMPTKEQYYEDFFLSRGLEYPQGTLKSFIKKKKDEGLRERTYMEITI